jgi:hypothetical protein
VKGSWGEEKKELQLSSYASSFLGICNLSSFVKCYRVCSMRIAWPELRDEQAWIACCVRLKTRIGCEEKVTVEERIEQRPEKKVHGEDKPKYVYLEEDRRILPISCARTSPSQ